MSVTVSELSNAVFAAPEHGWVYFRRFLDPQVPLLHALPMTPLLTDSHLQV